MRKKAEMTLIGVGAEQRIEVIVTGDPEELGSLHTVFHQHEGAVYESLLKAYGLVTSAVDSHFETSEEDE